MIQWPIFKGLNIWLFCSSSGHKHFWDFLIVSPGVFIHTKGSYCISSITLSPEMGNSARLWGAHVRPGAGMAIIRRLHCARHGVSLGNSQSLLSTSSQHLLTSGFLLLQQKETFDSVPTLSRLLNASAVFSTVITSPFVAISQSWHW